MWLAGRVIGRRWCSRCWCVRERTRTDASDAACLSRTWRTCFAGRTARPAAGVRAEMTTAVATALSAVTPTSAQPNRSVRNRDPSVLSTRMKHPESNRDSCRRYGPRGPTCGPVVPPVLDDEAVSELVSAAVLVPVFRDARGDLRVVLVVRAAGGAHGGQIGLPGGKREPGDPSLLETALREAEEEVGLARDRVEIVAELDELDSRATGFRVKPYLGRIVPPGRWRLAGAEITELLTPTIDSLADVASRREEPIAVPSWP